ncbi:hypothetical protein GALL_524650 [mine drainage metagenome]|uniref:DUF3563 domain-containing protein n=1 Tax=mine drainage metagenome TaxID=410659 RepID=A0A1J5PL06_9ZZZZ
MSVFAQLIKAFQLFFMPQKDRDDSYLSKATDVYDLERRMREIDRRGLSADGYPNRH